MWNDNKYYNELCRRSISNSAHPGAEMLNDQRSSPHGDRILDADYYSTHLPDSIEAVFYLDDNCGDAYDFSDYDSGTVDVTQKTKH